MFSGFIVSTTCLRKQGTEETVGKSFSACYFVNILVFNAHFGLIYTTHYDIDVFNL